MTGNGNHTTYKNGHDWGMVYGIVLPALVEVDWDLMGFNKIEWVSWVFNGAEWSSIRM